MVNLRLIGGYVSDLAVATASSTAAGFDAQNVVALDRPTKWRASGAGAAWIRLDLGSAKLVTAFAIANHNGNLWTSPDLEWSTDGSTGWTSIHALTGLTSGQDYYATLGAGQTKQFWRIDVSGSSSAMELGCFYLGTPITLSKNPSYDFSEDEVYNVETDRSSSGAVVAEQFGRRLARFDMRWRYGDNTVRNEVRNFLRTEGGPLRPFFYVPIDESGSSTSGQTFMVRNLPLAWQVNRAFINTYEFGLTLLEES